MTDWELRPARDHGLSPAERLRSQGREPGLGSLVLGTAWRALVWCYLRLFHRLRVVPARPHWPEPPFVLVANHASHLDALTLAASLPPQLARRAFALAAGDTFFTSLPLAAFASYAINAHPVWRKRTKASDLAAMRQRLDDGAILMVFPEGTRTRTGAMGRFQPGIGALVAGTSVPVLPCRIEGAYAAWPATRRLPRPGRLRLHVGAPLRFDAVAADRAGLAVVAGQCEAAVRALAAG